MAATPEPGPPAATASPPRRWPRRRLALLGISAALLAAHVIVVPHDPRVALGKWCSDHYAHYSSAILFWYRGTAVYRTPTRELCRPSPGLAGSELRDFGYLCSLPERGSRRPLVFNWEQLPRPYPPGAFIYAAPEALLYEHTALSFRAINRLTVLKHLLVAHLCVGLALGLLFGGPTRSPEPEAWAGWPFLLVPLVYLQLVTWALAGIYDGVAIACLLLVIDRLRRDDAPAALLLFATAAFLHFRAVWYLPLAVVALLRLGAPSTRAALRRPRTLLLLGGALVLGGLAAGAFAVVAPALAEFPHNNPVHLLAFHLPSPAHWSFVVTAIGAAAFLALRRQWLLAGLLAWQTVTIGLTYQIQPWHTLFLLPLFAVAAWRRSPTPALVALLATYVVFSAVAFHSLELPGNLIGPLFGSTR